MSEEPRAESARLLVRAGVPLALGLATLLLYGRVLRYGMLGHDSYPILLTARIRSLDDLWACLSQPLMDGRFEGAFYRPLLDLSFAFDEALGPTFPAAFR